MDFKSTQQIREGLRQCLVIGNCEFCPYYNRGNNCQEFLQKDADLLLQRFEILIDNGD